MSEIIERGPWEAHWEEDGNKYVAYIESDDFHHDVRLIVNGDFEGNGQRFAYAQEIAKRLNAWSVCEPGGQ